MTGNGLGREEVAVLGAIGGGRRRWGFTVTGLPTPAPIDSILSSLRASSSAFCCSRKPVRYDDLSVYDDTDAAGG